MSQMSGKRLSRKTTETFKEELAHLAQFEEHLYRGMLMNNTNKPGKKSMEDATVEEWRTNSTRCVKQTNQTEKQFNVEGYHAQEFLLDDVAPIKTNCLLFLNIFQ